MKFFIAYKATNLSQAKTLGDNLLSLGHEISNPLSLNDETLFLAGVDWKDRKDLRKIFERDLTALESADVVVLLLPAGRNAHISAGIGYGFGKRLVLIGEPEAIESEYFIFEEQHPSVEAYIAALKK